MHFEGVGVGVESLVNRIEIFSVRNFIEGPYLNRVRASTSYRDGTVEGTPGYACEHQTFILPTHGQKTVVSICDTGFHPLYKTIIVRTWRI
jgi:hypothetical protein